MDPSGAGELEDAFSEAFSPTSLPEDEGGPPGGLEPEKDPPPSPPGDTVDEEMAKIRDNIEGGKRGVFAVTAKVSGGYGGYQASCKFHRLSKRTGCKQFLLFLTHEVGANLQH